MLRIAMVVLALSVLPAQAFQPLSCYTKGALEGWLIDGKTMKRFGSSSKPETFTLADYRRVGHTDTWSLTIGGQPHAGGLEIFDRRAAGWTQGTATIWARCEPISR